MSPHVDVIGVYEVPEAPEPCHLIEVAVRDSPGFDPGEFVQPDPWLPESEWQAAYDERALNDAGEPITEAFELRDRPELLQGDARLTFFLHYLDPSQPLRTPFGTVDLPAASSRPDRLAAIVYEEP